MSDKRWSIWIDLEGFKSLLGSQSARAIGGLRELMEALFRIGAFVFPEPVERLFIHQFGDGFVVVSDFQEDSADRPISICVALMRHLLSKGFVAKAAISTGDFGDISGCYPTIVRKNASSERHVLHIGSGIMTIQTIMGSALINAYAISDQCKGSVLLLDISRFLTVSSDIIMLSGAPALVDWIHTEFPMVSDICAKAGLNKLDPDMAEKKLKKYIDENDLPAEWIKSTLESAGITAEN